MAIVATIKTVPGKRDEYLAVLQSSWEMVSRHRGTLQFEILVPEEETDTVMLYEVYASPEAFQTHWNGVAAGETKGSGSTGELKRRALQCG